MAEIVRLVLAHKIAGKFVVALAIRDCTGILIGVPKHSIGSSRRYEQLRAELLEVLLALAVVLKARETLRLLLCNTTRTVKISWNVLGPILLMKLEASDVVPRKLFS